MNTKKYIRNILGDYTSKNLDAASIKVLGDRYDNNVKELLRKYKNKEKLTIDEKMMLYDYLKNVRK